MLVSSTKRRIGLSTSEGSLTYKLKSIANGPRTDLRGTPLITFDQVDAGQPDAS